MKIVNGEDSPVEDGQRGEILVRGPSFTVGYFKNPVATAQAFTSDGWFRTGDIGLRKNGLFYIVDRKKVNYPFSMITFHPDMLPRS